MLMRAIRQRPGRLVTVYVETDRVEVLWAHRKWRAWEVDSSELYTVAEGETVFELLQRLSLRARDPEKTALAVFLSLPFYSCHREHYPSALDQQLEHAVAFDWQENLFHDVDQMLAFAGPPIKMEHHLSVPILSMRREIHEKLNLALSGAAYQSFSVIPSNLYYAVFAEGEALGSRTGGDSLLTFGRMVSPTQMEVHRFLGGTLLESYLVGKGNGTAPIVGEILRCSNGADNGEGDWIDVIESARAPDDAARTEAFSRELPVRLRTVEGLMTTQWVPRLFRQESVNTFEGSIVLKPWEVPKVVWPVLAALALYGCFALYHFHDFNRVNEASTRLKRQIATLESQWKPIEQLQTRIAKFEEDQKTLSQFDLEGYPLLEMLTVLSVVTPDDTWLNYFSIRKGQVILRGESKSAIKFLPELSKIEGFSDVKFASPVTRNPSADSERFNVQLQLDGEKFRKALASLSFTREEEKVESPAVPPEEPPAKSPEENKVELTAPRAPEPVDEDTEVVEEVIEEEQVQEEPMEEVVEEDTSAHSQ